MENSNNQSSYYGGNPSYVSQMNEEEKKAKQVEDAREFRSLGVASVIYAIVFVVCLYNNFSGITSPIWASVTIYYMYYAEKAFQGKWSIFNTFMSGAIVLLGFSNFCTDNSIIIALNYLAIVTLIVVNVVTIFVNTGKVNVTNHIVVITMALLNSIGEWGAPFSQMSAFVKEKKAKKNEKTIYVLIGIAIAIPMLVVITSILASADGVFFQMFNQVGRLLSLDVLFDNIFGIAFMGVIGYILPYSFIRNAKSRNINVKEGKSGNHEPIIAIIVTATISVVYVVFSLIQIYYLFLGNGTLPANYTYAEYAREGFFQLLFVCAFNMVMVLACIEFFKDSKILSIILYIVSGCTFIMIASSAYRMGMYIGEYGLTFTRAFVLWALIVITFIMLGLIYQIYKKEFSLFRYCVVVVSVCFIGLAFSHIDYFIAEYNLEFYEQKESEIMTDSYWTEYVDYNYLLSLSADAAPAFAKHWDVMEEYIKKEDEGVTSYFWPQSRYNVGYYKYERMTFRNFNLSRYIAIESMKEE